tara:strand:- start:418 stop:732 length:315 start_codon:yes stop_codon:yes gene_type:complete
MSKKVIRIDDDMFQRLLFGIREHQDPENLVVELTNEEDDMIIYDNGMMCVCYGDEACWFKMSQLCSEQKSAIENELCTQIYRVVENTIFDAFKEARENGSCRGV